jgi:glutamine amidotransferase
VIAIVDYGLGNIRAFENILKRLGVPHCIARNELELSPATKIILPGVGAFDHAMDLLERSGMRGALDRLVLQDKRPVIGICVGMQILGRSSAEGRLPGLGWVPGEVRSMKADDLQPRGQLPHMGWNRVHPKTIDGLFRQMSLDPDFYFLHSYYFKCDKSNHVLAETEYGGKFASAVANEHVFGVQFHPEKSHHNGIQLLKNFAELPSC